MTNKKKKSPVTESQNGDNKKLSLKQPQKQFDKAASLSMGIEISTKPGPILRPEQINFWDLNPNSMEKSFNSTGTPLHTPPQHLSQLPPQSPFKYYTDAILGLSFHCLSDFRFVATEQIPFVQKSYHTLNPYLSLYASSSQRLSALVDESQFSKFAAKSNYEVLPIGRAKTAKANTIVEFEKSMLAKWQSLFKDKSVSVAGLRGLQDLLSKFEKELEKPFLYNFGFQFSKDFTEQLICFYSLLFHLRALVAVDHNAHADDTSFESIKCDSISDYLPKSDYTVNDALLYLHFKNLSKPFVGHKDKDPRIEKLFVEPMLKSFSQYSHNACCLIDHLPESFLTSQPLTELEESLHQVQMDWLLGSSSGLLFKIREELYGLCDGYEKIFWPEAASSYVKKSTFLNISFRLSEDDLAKELVAA